LVTPPTARGSRPTEPGIIGDQISAPWGLAYRSVTALVTVTIAAFFLGRRDDERRSATTDLVGVAPERPDAAAGMDRQRVEP